MRVFVAIDLPDLVADQLEALQNDLTIGRPTPAENFHLTLSFLGDQSDDDLETAHEALSAIRAPAFDLQLLGVGSFGKRSPQVIYADVRRIPELIELERRVTLSLRGAGLDFEKRRFRPHVTLARLPGRLAPFEVEEVRDFLAGHAAFQGSWFNVAEFHLYRSVLTAKAARHDILASYDLMPA